MDPESEALIRKLHRELNGLTRSTRGGDRGNRSSSLRPKGEQQQPPGGAAAPEPAARPLRFEYEVTLVACPASEPVAVGARVPSSGGGEAGKRVSIVYYVNEDLESFWYGVTSGVSKQDAHAAHSSA